MEEKQVNLLKQGMSKYTGIKTIRAVSMTRGAYNKLRGWEVPSNEDPNDEGYLVEYTDGGTPNTTEFEGYISWSPRGVFERAYHQTATPKQCVGYELNETMVKIRSLSNLLHNQEWAKEQSDKFLGICLRQLLALEEYANILTRKEYVIPEK
jgi:hypothetical protein